MRSSSLRAFAFAVATACLVAPSAAWARVHAAEAAPAQAPAVRLVKIQYDPPGDDDLTNSSLNREWVAIHNFGAKPAKLAGWVLRDVSGSRYTFTTDFTLAPGATVTVHTGTGADRAAARLLGPGQLHLEQHRRQGDAQERRGHGRRRVRLRRRRRLGLLLTHPAAGCESHFREAATGGSPGGLRSPLPPTKGSR